MKATTRFRFDALAAGTLSALFLAASSTAFAQRPDGPQDRPQGGPGGFGGRPGAARSGAPLGGPQGASAMAAAGEYVYIFRGDTLEQISADTLAVLKSARVEAPAFGPGPKERAGMARRPGGPAGAGPALRGPMPQGPEDDAAAGPAGPKAGPEPEDRAPAGPEAATPARPDRGVGPGPDDMMDPMGPPMPDDDYAGPMPGAPERPMGPPMGPRGGFPSGMGMGGGRGMQPGMGMMPGGPGMPGMRGMRGAQPGRPAAPAVTITATDKYVYLLRGNTLYQFTVKDLKLAKKTELPRPTAPRAPADAPKTEK